MAPTEATPITDPPPTAPADDPQALAALDWVAGAVSGCGIVEVLEAHAVPSDQVPGAYIVTIFVVDGMLSYLANFTTGQFVPMDPYAADVSAQCFS